MRPDRIFIFCAFFSLVVHVGFLYLFDELNVTKNVKSLKEMSNLEVSLEDTKSRDNKNIIQKITRREVPQKYIKKENINRLTDKVSNDKQGSNLTGNGDVLLARPDYKNAPKPDYPVIAKKMGYEGLVNLRVRILENGSVSEILILNSSGYNILDNAAKKAVVKWSFFPASKNGKPFACWINVPVRFELK